MINTHSAERKSTLKLSRPKQKMDHAYLGPDFSDSEIEDYLKDNEIVYVRFDSDQELVEKQQR